MGSSPRARAASSLPPERKLHKYKRMSARAGKPLLDFAAEADSRRLRRAAHRSLGRRELELEIAEACRRRAARERCAGWLARTGLS